VGAPLIEVGALKLRYRRAIPLIEVGALKLRYRRAIHMTNGFS